MPLVLHNYLDMEYKDGSDDTLRRLTDEFGRHKLTDVQEENEEDAAAGFLMSAPRNRYSSIGSTASSMDYLWDLQPRRLSEAGLSRHSDNSTILTEDTDSFIIGQRVWVGGTKPGSIAYIGETQFAPGDWAGIVLDQPIGKNDGSVGGIRYFQCEPKKGVFSRLTRLTRYSLNDPEMTITDLATSTPVNGTRRSPISPSGSTSPFKSPPSLTTSNTSLASVHVDYKLGDRVIIKSSQGSKIGTLRFMGSTEFAAGEWCGVELDEPRGKNDGSVGGMRYFDCRPNFGLFAPISKVSKSPSNRKPGACVVHSGAGLPPSGFRRANSKESLTSNISITSAASGVRRVRLGVTSLTTPQRASPKTPAAPLPTRTALQEVLKEKQQHIEQLLKERDLERAEIAKAASQADEAEQNFATLKHEYEFYKLDSEKKLQEYVNLLTQLKREMSELLSNFEDEKRKNEDLQFRFEEAAITKADLEITNETNEMRISELESQLSLERQRIDLLEGDSNKLFEAEESLVRVKEENEALKYEIEVAAQKILSLESEGSSNKDLISNHMKELDDMQSLAKQKDETIEKIKTDIKSISDQYEQSRINFTKEIEEYKSKVDVANNESNELKTTLDSLRTEFNQTKNELNEKTVALEKTINNAKDVESKFNKEIEKLRMNLSGKSLDLETTNEIVKKKEEEIKQMQSELESFKNNLVTQNVDIDKFKDNVKEIENNLRKELEESRSVIKIKINELEEVKKELAVTNSQKETELKEANKTIKNYLDDIEKLNDTITEIKESNIRNNNEIQNSFSQKLQESEKKNEDLVKTLNEKEEVLTKSTEEVFKLQKEINSKTDEIKNVQENITAIKGKFEEETASLAKANELLNQLHLNVNDLERKSKISEENSLELVQQKTRLEDEIRMLVGSSGDFSNKVDEMSRALHEKDKNIENIKNDLTMKLQDMERLKEEIELKLNTQNSKSEKEIKERDEIISNLTANKNLLKEEYEKTLNDNNTLIDGLSIKINEVQSALENKENLLKKYEEELKLTQEKSRLDLETAFGDYNTKFESLQRKLDVAVKDNEEFKDALSKKSLELIEMESKYNRQTELSKQTEHELKCTFEEKLKNLEYQLDAKEKEKSNSIDLTRNQLDEKIKEIENKSDALTKEFKVKIEHLEKQKVEDEEKMKLLLTENTEIKENSEKNTAENIKVINDIKIIIQDLEATLKEKDLALQKFQEESSSKESDLSQQLSKYSGDLQATIKEYETQIDCLNKEKVNILENLTEKGKEVENNILKYNELIDKNKQESNALQNTFDQEKKTLLEQLACLTQEVNYKNAEIEKFKDSNKTSDLKFTEKDKETEQLKAELRINHDFIERLQSEKKELLQDKENLVNAELEQGKHCVKLTEEISQLGREMQHLNENSYQLQIASNLYTTILQLLQLTEEQKIKLVDKMEADVKANCDTEGYTNLCKLVDGIKIFEDDTKDKKIKELEKEIETYKHNQFELETRLKRQESHIPKPKSDSQKLQDGNKIVNNQKKLDNSTASSLINNNEITNEQLMEEKLLAENQVAFLNSIIVDMQKKNEEQKSRIEILESGYSPAAAAELGLFRCDRQLPPRMYCDICEEFDLHETEDCPQQANEDLPAREKSPKEKPPPRPYCEICEIFGHATEDCQDDQTF